VEYWVAPGDRHQEILGWGLGGVLGFACAKLDYSKHDFIFYFFEAVYNLPFFPFFPFSKLTWLQFLNDFSASI
jgi:hypothetical protein